MSVDPCTNFYNFTCGRYRANSDYNKLFNITTSGLKNYYEKLQEIKEFLNSSRELSVGYDISVARNVYATCVNLSYCIVSKLFQVYNTNFDN